MPTLSWAPLPLRLRPRPSSSLPLHHTRRFTSAHSPSTQRLPLAYDLHEPTNPGRAEEARSRPAIIFLHGLFGSKKNNRSISKALARDLRRRIFAVDLRNHGDSPHHTQHDYTAMAADVEGFIEDHKLSHPVLIGHSMGAKTAMALSLQDPSLISALVSVDNAPLDAALPSSFPAYISGMRTIEASSTTRQRDADAILATHEPSLPIRQFLLTNLHRPSPSSPDLKFRIPIDVLARALDHMADFPFKDPAQVRYDGPTLFVRGTRSRYVADDALPLVGAFFPRFELRDVEAGHWLISENPEGFRRAVVEFLEDKG